jgi:hypothetical protein
MKKTNITTHELADLLVGLARMLRSMPDGPLDEEFQLVRHRERALKTSALSEPSALVALVGFSKFTKNDWAKFIEELDLPIRVEPRHASRDLMGKIVGYFADNPEGRVRLRNMSKRGVRGEASQALLDAFSVLMRSS